MLKLKLTRAWRPSAAFAAAVLSVVPLSSRGQTPGTAPAAKPKGRPNVLFIAVDDLKPTIGSFGDSFALTPNLDKLSAKGTIFLNAHCQQALCGPSRASLLTGLRPDTTGVYDLQRKFRDVLPDVVTLPQHFKNSGYEVVGLGKIYDPRNTEGPAVMDRLSWSRPYLTPKAEADATYGYLDPNLTPIIRKGAADAEAAGVKGWNETLRFIGKRPPFESADVPDDAYKDGVLARDGAELIRALAADEKPYFLAVGFAKPHLPFNAPTKYWNWYDRDAIPMPTFRTAPAEAPPYAGQDSWELRAGYTDVPKKGPIDEATQRSMAHGYYASVSYLDAQVGRLTQAVEASGEAENTIIVLWGDHGFHLGDHGMWCKHTNYEQATRAPLIVVAPSSGIAPSKSSAPVELLDVYPTLCAFAGLVPPKVQGVDLAPTMRDPAVDVKAYAISQFPRDTPDGQLMGYALRDRRYRFVQWRRSRDNRATAEVVAEEFYDLKADPEETRNVLGSTSPETLARFRDFARIRLPLTGP